MNKQDLRMNVSGQSEQNLFPQEPGPQDQSIVGLVQKMVNIENEIETLKTKLEHSEQKRLWLDPKILLAIIAAILAVVSVLLIAFYHVTNRIDMLHGRIDQIYQRLLPGNPESGLLPQNSEEPE